MTAARKEFRLDRDTVAEWLVISADADAQTVSEAVNQARERGMRVNHLTITGLEADTDAEILRASAGVKHIVVADRDSGELAANVRRLLPQIGVVPANSATAPVAAALVLERLLRTPRCC
jgi:hypothetical protein